MKVSGFQCYRTYLALKNHFGSGNYDYFLYGGKTSVKEQTFKMRKDRYFFEAMSRKRSEKEVIDFFLSNFVASDDPAKLWIRSILKDGESNYNSWRKRNRNLTYQFSNDIDEIFIRDKKKLPPTSGKKPIAVSGIASFVVSVTTL